MLGFPTLQGKCHQTTLHLHKMDASPGAASALGRRTGALLHLLPEIETENKNSPHGQGASLQNCHFFCHLRLHVLALGHFPLQLPIKLQDGFLLEILQDRGWQQGSATGWSNKVWAVLPFLLHPQFCRVSPTPTWHRGHFLQARHSAERKIPRTG